jgi:integrating conjugative element protein (TIGR03761 family)
MVTLRRTQVDAAIDAFARSSSSPFVDGYDLDGERAILVDLIADGDPDPADPLFARYQLYTEREQSLQNMQDLHTMRQEADALVTVSNALKIRQIGGLSSDGGDRMNLHTRDAMRMFLGRSVKPGEKGYPMAGGKRVAAALRALWSLSANDNPYADWKLIEISERIAGLRHAIALEQRDILAKLDAMKQKGLDYTILQSREPASLVLGFASPYGYMIATLLVELDYLVRVVKSAVLRDLITSSSGFHRVSLAKHKCLSVFHFAVGCQQALSRPELIRLCRTDFLPIGDAAAKQRVEAARALLGPVPKDVFMGQVQPRHSRRRVKHLSDAELRLLDSVPLSDDAEEANSAAKPLVQ